MNSDVLPNKYIRSVSTHDCNYRVGDTGLGENHNGTITSIEIVFVKELGSTEFIVFVDEVQYVHVPYHAVQRWIEGSR